MVRMLAGQDNVRDSGSGDVYWSGTMVTVGGGILTMVTGRMDT